MTLPTEDIIKLVAAFLAGGIVGYERESQNKPAGLRTIMLITMGSTIFSIVSLSVVGGSYDRIASNIVTGVGFVGGGVIFKEGATLKGITTASTIWMSAAIGMEIGFGQYWLAAVTIVLVLTILTLLENIEDRFAERKTKRLYKINFNISRCTLQQVKQMLAKLEVHCSERKLVRQGEIVTVEFMIKANKKDLHVVDGFLLSEPLIEGFEV